MSSALPARHQHRIDEQLRVLARARQLLAGRHPRYDAHIRVRGASGRETDVLLGSESRASAGLALVDWRTAPLAEVFFGFDEGEEYAVDVADRALEGVLLARNIVAFEAGELVELVTPDAMLSRRGGGPWREVAAPARPALRPRPAERRRTPASPLDVELDPAQRRVVDLPPGRAALVLGEAGCGKTTVALRRLARLAASWDGRFRAAVIVPTEGLRRLAESFVEALGRSGIEVRLYDAFAAAQARRCFQAVPRRESVGAAAGVVRLKRHVGVRAALAELAARPPARADEDRPGRRSSALVRREDLHALFGDRLLVEKIVAASDGALGGGAIAEVLDHTRLQYGPTADEEFAHVSLEARRTADGRPIDEGTPTEDAGSIDVEDYAILFELDRLRAQAGAGRVAAPTRYDCIVLDEAQELAPLELALIGRSLAPGGTLVVAGDADQQVDPTTSFPGWPAAMAELGTREYESAFLEVSYRCPPEVTAWARRLRVDTSAAPAHAPALAAFESECHLAAWLLGELRGLVASDPGAAIAVVCRTRQAAEVLARVLGYGVAVRLALDGRFTFRPGIHVTCVDEVKGLEFDHVVLPDATRASYPDAPAARRALYVAATRAMHQVLLAAAGAASPLGT